MTTFDPEKVTFFAKTDARGQEVPFGIRAEDRQRHMYVVGKTGMGKSTLLENMAAQDIQNGEGMAFIDPHGSAAETLLEYVPEHRVQDVVYFAPFDLDHPISFNVMEDVGPDKRHLVVSGLMSTFKKIWVDAWSSRMEYILTNALLALIEYPDTTLLSVNRLFADKEYRDKVVDYIKDPAVKAFWTDEFANYTERFAAEALPAIQNKVGQFTGNPLIRNIIGQPNSSFDIRKLMDEKKILIMNLSKGLIGETNANLLGSMLTTRIYLAAMSRADLPVEQMKQMPNFYFYVDEFQSFANATFANILSEARKYHLNLIIAHQYIEQMEEDVRNAVFGNVGTTISFRVGPFDAETLETVFAPRFLATDLVNLGFAQIYLTLMIEGIGSQPFSAKTLPPVALPPVSCRDMVIEASRKLYAHDRSAVEKLVSDLHAPEKKSVPEQKENSKKPTGNANWSDRPKNNNNGSKPGGAQGQRNGGNESNYSKNRKNGNAPTGNRAVAEKRETPKPAGANKTPDDLRAILAKMTRDSGGQKSNSISVSTEATAGSTARSSEKTKSADMPKKTDAKKENPQSNLKAALSEVLATVPKSVSTSSSATTSIQKESSPQRHVNEKQERHRSISQMAPALRLKARPASRIDQVRRVAVERRRHTDDEISASEPAPDQNIDTATIKKMLRQNDNDRSPFSS